MCYNAMTCAPGEGVHVERLRCADVAQSAEQLSCKQQVIGSSPIVGSGDGLKDIVCSAGRERKMTVRVF